jgi:phosphocarrier protein FPr
MQDDRSIHVQSGQIYDNFRNLRRTGRYLKGNRMSDVQTVSFIAPLSGPLTALQDVPDPVFAQKLVGDGISIDPITNRLLAPCAGRITQVHPSHHAVTIMTESGLEVMLHIGVDTVNLRGKGFTPRIKAGASVATGDLLIEFDMDYVALNAKSLLTQMIITNGEQLRYHHRSGSVTAGKDCAFEVTLSGVDEAALDETFLGKAVLSAPVLIRNPSGLHARPCAVLAHGAKTFKATIDILCGDRKGNAKSTTALMKMELGKDEHVLIRATGSDAAAAVEALTELIRGGLGEAVTAAPEPVADVPLASTVRGVCASGGLAVGAVYQLKKPVLDVEEYTEGDQREIFEKSVQQAHLEITSLMNSTEGPHGDIFKAHLELLEDPEVLETVYAEIQRGKSAAFAWQKAYTEQAESLALLQNKLLAARAVDLRDVGIRTLRIILGHESECIVFPDQAIVFAEELSPSQTASLDRTKVLGLCTIGGGSSSHSAIIARSMGIPALAGLPAQAMHIPDGTRVVLDASNGLLEIDPPAERLADAERAQTRLIEKTREDAAHCQEPAVTLDGQTVTVSGNAGTPADVAAAPQAGAEGIGLLRSEFLFQDRSNPPEQKEQEQVYCGMIRELNGKPLVIRTMDIGGDKPLAYLPIPKEQNPFLGERGIRACLNNPEIFRQQLRAILAASAAGPVEVMFPMITTMDEFRQAKAMLEKERAAAGVPSVKIGMMVEVPAAAMLAEIFAVEVDFFSIGTNDLSQYVLAVDRGHPKFAALSDGLNPAVLMLIARTAEAARKYGKPVSVCGGLAADPYAVPLLIGMGIDKLSVPVSAVPAVKAQIRSLRRSACQDLLGQVLALSGAVEVRARVASFNQ